MPKENPSSEDADAKGSSDSPFNVYVINRMAEERQALEKEAEKFPDNLFTAFVSNRGGKQLIWGLEVTSRRLQKCFGHGKPRTGQKIAKCLSTFYHFLGNPPPDEHLELALDAENRFRELTGHDIWAFAMALLKIHRLYFRRPFEKTLKEELREKGVQILTIQQEPQYRPELSLPERMEKLAALLGREGPTPSTD